MLVPLNLTVLLLRTICSDLGVKPVYESAALSMLPKELA